MKEDITQRQRRCRQVASRCGLVMKEDITQLKSWAINNGYSCGLVMKEDITQREAQLMHDPIVVVW